MLTNLSPGTRPTGTVTFLFTDIEGSTKRGEATPAAMQAAFARQEAIMREAIEANGGYAYKMAGNALQVAFPTAPQALQATIDAQRALHQESWAAETGEVSVRMAVHTAATEERGDDYVGPALNRVARLMAVGHGGQVLVTLATQQLLRDNLPSGVALRDLGEHSLKDLTQPERIFEVVAEGLPAEFPRLRVLDSCPNNLPRQATPFVGREKEVQAVAALLRKPDAALITLTGPGGIGKTRLALQAAEAVREVAGEDTGEALDNFPDGVWFVELAALLDHNLVIATIAQDLGLKEVRGNRPIIDTLTEYLKEKHLLLVLDNFEQVVEAATHVSGLLGECIHLKVLATSRVRLHISGEREYSVPPLATPDIREGHLPPLESLSRYEAVSLFVDRATNVKADFQVTAGNAPVIAQICAKLNGLPLAIELAAAKVRLLTLSTLLARLSGHLSLKLLSGGNRDVPERQRTLRNTLEWSYDLLDEGSKRLFRRMAVFSGGQTFDATEAVCSGKDTTLAPLEVDVLDGAETLLLNGLLQQREAGIEPEGGPRFWMLETIHEYAREKLDESGEAAAMRKAHALYFMGLAEEAEPHLLGEEQAGWFGRLEDEQDNLRAALWWASEQGAGGTASHQGSQGEPEASDRGLNAEAAEAAEVGLRIAWAILRYWVVRGLHTEGREHFARLLSMPPLILQACSSSSRARALNGAGLLAFRQADYSAARPFFDQALAVSREAGDKQGISISLNNLGNVAKEEEDYQAARSLCEESLALCRELGDRWGVAASLNNLGLIAHEQGDYATTRTRHEESLALRRELGDKWGVASSLNNLGLVVYEYGDYATARSLHEESLAIKRGLGDKWGIASSLNNLGFLAHEQGDYQAAHALYEEGLALRRELGDKWGIALSLNNLGNVANEQGDYATARALHEESLALRRELGPKLGIALALGSLGVVASNQHDYPKARALAVQSLALTVEVGKRREIAESLARAGEVFVAAGTELAKSERAQGQTEIERGTRMLGAAESILQSIGVMLYHQDRLPFERSAQEARTQLGEKLFEQAWEEGRAMSVEEAIEHANE
ncbi:MAG: ATP-binding protein [Chloroflexia bacterium]